MKGLGTALKMLSEDRSCRRVMVSVGMGSVDRAGTQFADAIMGAPPDVRSKVVIGLRLQGEGVPVACADFAQALQAVAGVSVAAWVCCDRTEFVADVMEGIAPATLAIEAKCPSGLPSTAHYRNSIGTGAATSTR
jgi:hypothetical protein